MGRRKVLRLSPTGVFLLLTAHLIAVASAQAAFFEEKLSLRVTEGVAAGTVIGSIEKKPGYTYRLNERSRFFDFDPDSGQIKTINELDREQLNGDSVDLIILGTPAYFITVTVQVDDINDNDPVFPFPFQNISVVESASVGTRLVLHSAQDPDAGDNGKIKEYRIASTDDAADTFKLVQSTNPDGDNVILLDVTKALDREKRDLYVLNISAVDSGEPPRAGFVTVFVNVLDTNDNAPVFSRAHYDVAISETTDAGTQLLVVNASDADASENAQVVYYLSNDIKNQFQVDGLSGAISTRVNKLDCPRTCQPDQQKNCTRVCVFTVEADDHGSPKQSGRAFVNVRLIDENDHDPEIVFRLYPAGVTFASVDEAAVNGSTVAVLTVVDKDFDANGQADVRIAAGNELGHFRLEAGENYAILRVSEVLHREQVSSYNLTFIAQDHGTPPRSSTKSLQVFVRDVNDRPPKFAQSSYVVQLSEAAPIGSFVVAVSANTDNSSRHQHSVSTIYSLSSGNELGFFKIAQKTGLITLAKSVDYETTRLYNLTVAARNDGPSIQFSTATVTVVVADANDHRPQFADDLKELFVNENLPLGSVLAILRASDGDEGENGRLSFYLDAATNRTYPAQFAVDAQSGKLILSRLLDRELIDSYYITVHVKDNGTPSLADQINLKLNVIDANDNWPTFRPREYFASILKSDPPGTPIAQVAASDEDAGTNGTVFYFILQAPVGAFDLDTASGRLSLRKAADALGSISPVQVIVGARDGGDLEAVNNATVHVFLLDDFSQTPQFVQPKSLFKVRERLAGGQVIGTLSATDADNRVEYRLIGSDAFDIGRYSGEIRTNRPLDREMTPTVELMVVAKGKLAASAMTVSVAVEDVNDEAPVFGIAANTTVTVSRDRPAGYPLLLAAATDADDDFKEIIYSLRNVSDFVFINNATGLISLKSPGYLLPEKDITIDVVAANLGSPPQFASTTVIISAVPAADLAFPRLHFTFVLSENAKVNSIVHPINYTSGLVDARVVFNAEAQDDHAPFGVFPDGKIFIKNPLDYETIQSYSLPIIASADFADGQRTTTKIVADFYLLDENDNAPKCDAELFSFELQENAPIGTYIGTAKATDFDSGLNGKIAYRLLTENDNFLIDSTTGSLTSLVVFDREDLMLRAKTDTLTVQIRVSDQGEPKLWAECAVRVRITDANDHSPEFLVDVYSADMLENAAVGAEVLKVTAIDADQGDNALVSYHLVDGFNTFSLNETSGKLSLIATLDRETKDSYHLSIEARDAGRPSQSTFIPAVISVLDVNDQSPKFIRYPRKALNLSESLPVGSEIATFTAEDGDIGLAGRCHYFISTGNIGRTFEIDPVTGRMILIRPLDFEATPAYTLTVSANDEGSPSLAASVPFVINIIDENDNAPIILTAIGQVQENAPVEKPILTLRATDADSGLNGQIKFKIVDQSPTNAFHLKGDKIYAEAALDREAVEQYELLIEASDLGQPALSSQRQITIIVTDQNDNAPRWVGVRAGAVDVSTQSVSKPIALMRAIDDDAGLNGSVGYRLLTRGSDDLFTMTADGQLFLSEPLRNPAPLYRLSVEAMDRTDLSGRSARKVNDFDRRSIEVPFTVIAAMQSSALNFATKEYRFEVAEDAKVGTEIGNVRASGVSGGKVEYFVTDAHSNSSSATGKMEQLTIDVDEKSGQLRVVAPLDRETTQGALFLSVHAVNTGANGPQAAHCTVIIVILDVNDEPPKLNKTDYIFKVSESARIGTEIGQIEATDPDLSGAITYSWSNAISSSPFALNPQSGLITLKSTLDRETTGEYRLMMTVSDSVNSVSATVRVVVIEENDNKPNFVFPGADRFYSFLVPEGTQRNSFVGRVEATDVDEARNGQVKYFIQTPGIEQVFNLDENSGVLTVNGYIDHETNPLFSFRISVTDLGAPALSTEADVFVVVQDANDNQPKFDPAIYEITVAENTTVGTKLIKLQATDVDTDTDFHYTIQSGDPNGLFSVDDDGNVMLAKELDRETCAVHQLTVRVTDQEPSMFHHSASAQLTITVSDVNDNHPVFVSATRLIVRENSPIGTVVSVLKAVDADEGLAGQVEYRLESASVPNGVFSVDPVLGYLKVNGPIDRELRSSYNLSINAYDRGSPSLSTEQFVLVDILDANDNYPSFTSHLDQVQVAENAVIGQRIVQLSATDMDIGQNAASIFWIAGGDKENHFVIDPDSGVLSLRRPLNFEEKRNYNLTLAVANVVGGPASVTSLSIQVTDANDHRPTFPKDPIYIDVVENLAEPFPVAIGTTLAEDLDSGLNGKLAYAIVQGNTTVFRLDSVSGQLYSTMPLDREIQETYRLVVQVTDAGSPRLSSTGRVIITVLDSNDNTPVFDQPYYTAQIAENATVGTKILQVTATDTDKDANGAIHYSLRKSNDALPFAIDSETGVISTKKLLDRETFSSWTMAVIAEDSGEIFRQSSSINVTVTILDVNDNAPIIRNGRLDAYIKNSLTTGDFVYAVDAFDPDEGINGRLKFELSGKDAAKFSIDQNGVIVSTVAVKALDTFSLMATVYDGMGLNATTALGFYVRFANDFPVFKAAGTHTSKPIEVSELRTNTRITTVLAKSSKQAPSNRIHYSIAAGDPNGVFKIGATSGHLSTTEKVDREERDAYRLWIAATDFDNPPLSSYMAINVAILDENDNDPQFEHAVYEALVQENTPAPTVVTTVRATDRDSGANAAIKYRIVAGDDYQAFEIDAKTGAISTMIELDRERASEYRLVVEAEDQGAPKRSARSVVRITVGDENDSSPRFTRLFTASISEDAALGSFVTQVTSVDLDSEEYSNNTYYLSSNPGRKFAIDPESGNVTLIAPLDRETVAEYQLKVIAVDGSWRVETSLTITIDDVNDNAPRFRPIAAPLAVTEKQPAGTVVDRVTAVDADAPGSSNSLISYSLKIRSDTFAVDSNTGEITTTGPLLFRSVSGANLAGNLHQLIVVATDGGRPPLKSEMTVNIQVIERNDHSPIFQKTSYRFAVAPATPVGAILGRLNATDEDDGPNGQISYALHSNATGSAGRYQVDAISGAIALKSQAPTVVGTVEKFEIRAQDRGSPRRQQTVSVQVEVVAPNQHSPEFSMARFELTVSETAPLGTAVTKFFARDADEGLNGVLQYSLTAVDELPFAINQDDGTLSVTALLDFETRSNYSFLITIADKGIPSKNSSAPVFIAIKDENDNAPEFEIDTIDVYVRENSPLGTQIVQIAASDKDGPPHDVIEYRLITTGEVPVALNSSTGELRVAGVIDFEQAQLYSVGVIARNPGSPANAKMVVNVHVTSENEFPPKFSQAQYSYQVGRRASVGSQVATVTAMDEDAGPDGIIYYFLDHLSQKKGFAIDRLSGAITIAEPLFDKNTDGKLTILAKNRRAHSIGDIARCLVSIDTNDTLLAGVFEHPTYEARISEDAPIGSNVLQLKASITDGGKFEIAAGDFSQIFGVDSKTGLIQVRGPMDRETVDVYELTVNFVIEARTTSTALVKITITDANDNGPEVIEGNRFGFVTEGDPIGTNIMTIRPVDKDLPPNQGPFKFRINSAEMAALFEIDEKSGVLRSGAVFDRERQALYRIPIAVTDAGKPPRTTTTTIEIGVNDLNDMPSLNASIEATVYLINGEYSGPVGFVRPADPDLVGDYACKISSGDASNLYHMTAGCELLSDTIRSPGLYRFNLSGTDGAHPWVDYLLTVKCESLTQQEADEAVRVVIDGLKEDIPSFADKLNALLKKSGRSVKLISLNSTGIRSHHVLFSVHEKDALLSGMQAEGVLRKAMQELQQQNVKRQSAAADSLRIETIAHDLCALNTCRNGGRCSMTTEMNNITTVYLRGETHLLAMPKIDRRIACDCPLTHTGQNCEIAVDHCKDNPCRNGGTCSTQNGSVICLCAEGFEGRLCEKDKNECDSDPCQNGGYCENTNGAFRCICLIGFAGRACETTVDHCDSNPCQNGATCEKNQEGFTCKCPFGFRGKHCEIISYGFGPLSYIELPRMNPHQNSLSLEFATKSKNALLLYSYNQAQGSQDYVAVDVVDGRLRLSARLSDQGHMNIILDRKVDDGQWYQLQIDHKYQSVTISVGPCPVEESQCKPCPLSDTTCRKTAYTGLAQVLVPGESIFLGGIKNFGDMVVRPGQVSAIDFVGCIRGFDLNGKTLETIEIRSKANLLDHCPRPEGGHCTSEMHEPECQGGRCIDDWDAPRCVCKDGYEARSCVDASTAASFNGGLIKYTLKEHTKRMQLFRPVDTATLVDSDDLLRVKRNADPGNWFELDIRTLSTDGLVFFAASGADFSMIDIVNGTLRYLSKTSDRPAVQVMLDIPVNDGIWHRISLELTSDNYSARLRMDGSGKEARSRLALHSFLTPSINFVTLGGLFRSDNGPSLVHVYGVSVPEFTGCMSRFVVNNEAQPLTSSGDDSSSSKSSSSHLFESTVIGRVVEGCSSPMGCIDPPCSSEPLSSKSTWTMALVAVVAFFSLCILLVIIASVAKKRWRKSHKKTPASNSKFSNLALVSNSGQLLSGSTLSLKDQASSGFGRDNAGFLSRDTDMSGSRLSFSTTHRASSVQLDPTSCMNRQQNGQRSERYDLDNASSIAPSDIDVSYHYRCYREGANTNSSRRKKNPKLERAQTDARGQSPLSQLQAMSQIRHSTPHRDSPTSVKALKAALRASPASAISSAGRSIPMTCISSTSEEERRTAESSRSRRSTRSRRSRDSSSRRKKSAGPLGGSEPQSVKDVRRYHSNPAFEDDDSSSSGPSPPRPAVPPRASILSAATRSPHAPPRRDSSDDQTTDLDLDRVRRPRRLLSGVIDDTETESELGGTAGRKTTVPSSLAPFRPPRTMFPVSEDESDAGPFRLASSSSVAQDRNAMKQKNAQLPNWYHQEGEGSSADDQTDDEPPMDARNLEAYV